MKWLAEIYSLCGSSQLGLHHSAIHIKNLQVQNIICQFSFFSFEVKTSHPLFHGDWSAVLKYGAFLGQRRNCCNIMLNSKAQSSYLAKGHVVLGQGQYDSSRKKQVSCRVWTFMSHSLLTSSDNCDSKQSNWCRFVDSKWVTCIQGTRLAPYWQCFVALSLIFCESLGDGFGDLAPNLSTGYLWHQHWGVWACSWMLLSVFIVFCIIYNR